MYFCGSMSTNTAHHIRHPGVVEKIETARVFVRIRSQAGCGHCQARGHCGMAESVDKIVEVDTPEAGSYSAGQAVEVFLSYSLGYKALMLGYIVPLLLLLSVLFAVALTTKNEGLAALSAVLLMLPYYAVLYHHRDRLRKTFHFRLRPAPKPENC